MDEKIKKLKSKTKSLVKDESSLLKLDIKQDAKLAKLEKAKHPSKKKHHKS